MSIVDLSVVTRLIHSVAQLTIGQSLLRLQRWRQLLSEVQVILLVLISHIIQFYKVLINNKEHPDAVVGRDRSDST